jgi:AcrR family transcriptional regulator
MAPIETKPPEAPRKPRADAVRNRARVLDAARSEFAAHGLDAQIDDIARAAGVGVGTVYRHFPTKDDLLEALADDHFEGLAAAARRALEHEDAWQGFEEFMTYAARAMAEDRALPEAMGVRPGICAAAAERAGLGELTAQVLGRAQASGQVRADAVPTDVPALVCGIGRAVSADSGEPVMSWERYLEIILAGLRT